MIDNKFIDYQVHILFFHNNIVHNDNYAAKETYRLQLYFKASLYVTQNHCS